MTGKPSSRARIGVRTSVEAIFLRQKPEERDVLLRLVPKVCNPCPATDPIVEFRIIDRDIERDVHL
jgi:hypothetical protein